MNLPLILPHAREVEAAILAQRKLAAYLATGLETKLVQLVDANGQPHALQLPDAALRLLNDVLSELADGNAAKIVSVHAELTTQDAADLFNVSRPHLVKLLDTGGLPFHKTGKHRRIRFEDLMGYKKLRDAKSASALEALAAEAQDLRMGYERTVRRSRRSLTLAFCIPRTFVTCCCGWPTRVAFVRAGADTFSLKALLGCQIRITGTSLPLQPVAVPV